MRILPVNFLKLQKTNVLQRQSYATKLQPLQTDVVSFGYLNEKVPPNIQLYRCIGEKEYQKLIEGEIISSSGYSTSSPKGWDANGWNDGFVPHGSDSNCYFITFKTNQFEDISDRRDSEADTRYGIIDDYSLSNISNIRKGFNTHGQIVWAENLELEKAKDFEHKKAEISRLFEIVKNKYDNRDKDSVIDELVSYIKEFPQIVSEFGKYVDYSTGENVNEFAYMIGYTYDEKYLQEFRKCIDCYLNGLIPEESVFDYFTFCGDKTDLCSYLKILDMYQFDSAHSIGSILANLAGEDEHQKIVDKFNTDNSSDLVILAHYYKESDKTGKYLKEIEKLLLKCDNLRKTSYLQAIIDDEKRLDLWLTIDTCMSYLAKFGTDESFAVIDLYCEDNENLIYRYYDAEDAKKKILRRLKNN